MFKRLKYRCHQKSFCRQYIKRINQMTDYKYFLKYYSKKRSIPSSLCYVMFYDVLDNNGMNRLIRSLYKLRKHKKKYSVSTHFFYRKFRKLDYINSNLTGTITGVIADVKLLSNKWIEYISICYTYLNSSQCLIQYSFHFKKRINTYLQIHNFVVDEIMKTKKEDYFHSYADKSFIKRADYKELWRLDDIFFADILQGYICSMFYTVYGKTYKLPVEYNEKIRGYNIKVRNKLRNPFLYSSYEKSRKHVTISTFQYDRFELTQYETGKNWPKSDLLRYFSYFSTEMYYRAFYHIETCELENAMRKYLNSHKAFVSSKDIKWFINRIKYIKEQRSKLEKIFANDNGKGITDMLGWQQYSSGKPTGKDLVNYPEFTDYFLNLYEQNLDYLNSMAAVQNNVVVILVAVATLVATLVGIIITLIK